MMDEELGLQHLLSHLAPSGPASDSLVDDFVNAAAWGVNPPTSRRPVIFIPSFAGVRLKVSLKDREIRAPWDALCRRNSDGWRSAWLPDKSDVGPLNAPCTVENIAFSMPASPDDPAYEPPRRGVLVEPEDSFDACMSLDVAGTYPTFGTWAAALERAGWRRGVDMDALPYDWRLGPDALAAPGGAFDRLRDAVEGLVARAGGRRAVALSMSMGGPAFALFCATHVSEPWKAAHLEGFVSLSGSFGGALSPLLTLIRGQWSDLLPGPAQPFVRAMAMTLGSLPWILPDAQVFGADWVIAETPTRTFRIADTGGLLRAAGGAVAAARWERFRGLAGLAPNVTTLCLYGVSRGRTPLRLRFPSEDLRSTWPFASPPQIDRGDGDGTVLMPSLEVCGGWGRVQRMGVETVTWPNVSHTDLLQLPGAYAEFTRFLARL